MTNDRSLFIDGEFTTLTDYMITTASGHIPTISIGNARINILTDSGKTTEMVLKNCLFVPDLFTNLMSLKKLKQNDVHFNTQTEALTYKGKVVADLDSTKNAWLVNWCRSDKASTIASAFAALALPPQF